MKISLTRLVKPLALTAATTAAVALVGCSAPAEPAASPAPVPSSSASQSAETTRAASASATAEASASPSPTAGSDTQGNDALLAAAGLAATEVSKGTVVSIEAERDGWEVHVVTADGGEQQLRIDAAGARVLAGPTDDRPDADDRADNKEFAQTDVDYMGAVRAIEKEISDGQIGELSLDNENRRAVWEADVSTGSEQRSVQIDATNGEVVSNRIDD
ncbi:MAG TPA: PepSY domain-containing protein [Microlunatus sp.]